MLKSNSKNKQRSSNNWRKSKKKKRNNGKKEEKKTIKVNKAAHNNQIKEIEKYYQSLINNLSKLNLILILIKRLSKGKILFKMMLLIDIQS